MSLKSAKCKPHILGSPDIKGKSAKLRKHGTIFSERE